MRYLHIHQEDAPGRVSTIQVWDDGYVAFSGPDGFSDEYSIKDLKDAIAEAEFNLDNPVGDVIDSDYDDLFDYREDDYSDNFPF